MDMKPEDFAPGALFGHYGAQWRGRGARSTEVLSSAEGFTLDDGVALALDTLTLAARYWQKPLMESYDGFRDEVQDAPEELDAAAEAVREWDGRIVRESVGATVFRFWREAYAGKYPETVGDNQAKAYPKTDEEKRDAMTALVAAVKRLQEIRGTALLPWGELLRLRHGSVELPLSGDAGVNMSEAMRSTGNGVLNDEGKFIFNGGQVVTTVVQLTDPIQVRTIAPFGQSLKPDSPHFTDQMSLYSQDRVRPAWHDWEQLKGNIESSETVTYTRAEGKE
jgi:acyl-homoserine-lactone acylase